MFANFELDMIGLDPATFCKAWRGILYMLGGQS